MKAIRNLLLATASLTSFTVPAFAQDVPAEEATDATGDEIVVTARRREESVQDVPLSIQAVSGQQLQKLEIRQFEDVVKVVPGLTLSKAGAGTSASLRGVNFDARASGASTAVEFYRNDAVTTAGALFQAVYDVGQIEVLRGPQGTLRGRASPSGSITLTTRRPNLSEPGGYVNGSVTDEGRWNFNGALNVPVIGDKFGIRVAGFVGRNRGNNIFGLNVPLNVIDSDVYDRSRALRASVRADPFDGMLVLDFNYETIRTSTRQFDQVQSASTFNGGATSPRTITVDDRLGVGAFAGTSERDIRIYNWQAVLRQWGQRLTYVGSRQTLSQYSIGPTDAGGLLGSPYALTPPNFAPINVFGQLSDNRVVQMTHELRLQNDERVAGMFDYVIGAFKVAGESPTILASPSVPSAAGGLPAGITSNGATPPLYTLNRFSYSARLRYRNDQEESLFGNLTLHLGESTELSGGLRHIWFKADSGLRAGSFGTPAAPTTPATGAEVAAIRRCYGNPSVAGCLPTKEATIYAASIKHKFNDDLMVYGSFGTSWRPGNALVGYAISVTPPPTLSPLVESFTNLPDETSKSFEIGVKSSWLDRRLRFNLSAFYQKFNNYPLFGSTTVQSVTQDGLTLIPAFNFAAPVNATIKGFEADLSFDVSPHFNISAAVAFADSQAKNALVPCVDINDDNVHDGTVTLPVLAAEVGTNMVDTCTINASPTSQPRWSGTVQAEYSHPFGFGDGFIRGFAAWKGESAGDGINPNDQVPAYALVDLFLGVRDPSGAWEVAGFVKNLFDTQQVVTRGGALLSTPTSSTTTASYNYYGISTTDPREFGVSLRYSFGSR